MNYVPVNYKLGNSEKKSETGMGVTFWIVAPVTALLILTLSSATLTDIHCLKTIKHSVRDPNGYLDGWDSANATEGVICKMTGVECWHPDENKVLNLRLSGFGLQGPFPGGLENCTSLTGLDLSYNNFSGPIPADVSRRLVFVTNLDLSSNHFSGEIPVGLANCSYLNVLKLDDNVLTGSIPPQLGQLGRINTFSVSGNLLSGPVPVFSNGTQVTAESYVRNPGLCGKPLRKCKGPPEKSRTGVTAAVAAGSVAVVAVVVAVGLYYLTPAVLRKKWKDDDPEGNKWAKSIKGTKGIKLSTFEKSLSKMRLSDLMKATNSFHKDNAIGGGRTGTMYKATLVDGQTLIVKRLQDSRHLEKEFASEMGILGTLRHANLVPLLGYCVADKERIVVYRYMENGTLHNRLHDPALGSPIDWPTRLRVAIGAAKGLAWLHHNCNPRIIHRNISSKCVLLDENFDAKLCDFGLARLMNPIDTHLSTFVNGEFGDLGYVAPEYPQKLVATPKGDVYSFGVVLLELATGESPTRVTRASAEGFKGSLVEWVSDLSAISNLRDALDPALLEGHESGRDNELAQFIKVACRCVLLNPKERPTMFEVYQLLRAIGERYHFTADEDVLVPTQTDNVSFPDDLIVAR